MTTIDSDGAPCDSFDGFYLQPKDVTTFGRKTAVLNTVGGETIGDPVRSAARTGDSWVRPLERRLAS